MLCSSTCDPDRLAALGERVAPARHPFSRDAGVRHQRGGAPGQGRRPDRRRPGARGRDQAGDRCALSARLSHRRLRRRQPRQARHQPDPRHQPHRAGGGLVFAERVGLDPATFLDVVEESALPIRASWKARAQRCCAAIIRPKGWCRFPKDATLMRDRAGSWPGIAAAGGLPRHPGGLRARPARRSSTTAAVIEKIRRGARKREAGHEAQRSMSRKWLAAPYCVLCSLDWALLDRRSTNCVYARQSRRLGAVPPPISMRYLGGYMRSMRASFPGSCGWRLGMARRAAAVAGPRSRRKRCRSHLHRRQQPVPTPAFVAVENGYWAKQGLNVKVKLTASGRAVTQACAPARRSSATPR